jgi:membrane protein DedA with SNARE-associated domain
MTEWITDAIAQLGYLGIAGLMFLENLFPPIPSELIMPLAGFTAADGRLNLYGVIAAGTLGTLVGAIFWYAVARRLGEEGLKRWTDRHGRWITLSRADVERIDAWFDRHGGWAVALGHLVPGVRTFISVPAGVFGMGFWRFVILTTIGGGVWTALLAVAGYLLGSEYEQVERYIGPVSTTMLLAIAAWYIYRVATFPRSSGGK